MFEIHGIKVKDMPKLQSPFERAEVNGKYVCIPKFNRKYEWILDKEKVLATEKFDGTNVSIVVVNHEIVQIMNRKNKIDIWKHGYWFYEGIKNAIDKGYINLKSLPDGQYFGELIGEKINGNPYDLKGHIWLPLEWIKKHYCFKFYYKWLDENGLSSNSSDEELFNAFSNLMKNLKSLWFLKKGGKEKPPEGIVFHNKETGEMCKLRRDMFDWYEGKPHKWYEAR